MGGRPQERISESCDYHEKVRMNRIVSDGFVGRIKLATNRFDARFQRYLVLPLSITVAVNMIPLQFMGSSNVT
jgi:hypothetical protein